MQHKSSACNVLVFRDGRQEIPTLSLVQSLTTALNSIAPSHHSPEVILNALLRAGELECALADCDASAGVSSLTDTLAAALIGFQNGEISAANLSTLLQGIQLPQRVIVSRPEGFAYYALHPLDFAALTRTVRLSSSYAAIIGIRSIGTTLGAVVKAALRQCGVAAERITVRPSGHPYDRRTHFSAGEARWIDAQRSRLADFLIVDEGPGLSGSSLLSVGEALLNRGVEADRIMFLCSRKPELSYLCAPNATQRWLTFRSCQSGSGENLPPEAKLYAGAGEWRAQLYRDESEWPASWVHMERLKFFSEDKHLLFKFEGLGQFGADVHERACTLAEAGWGPMPEGRQGGFTVYPMIAGRPLNSTDLSKSVVEQLARYCAHRASRLGAPNSDGTQLEKMARFNLGQEIGIEPEIEAGGLATAVPVIADGKMQPHEWLLGKDGKLFKIDSVSHGDDHFFPGPTDIAWDIAGAILEWEMPTQASDYLVERYQLISNDDIRSRLPCFLLAYLAFRLGYCKMAATALGGSDEEVRLLRDYRRYRALALEQLPQVVAA